MKGFLALALIQVFSLTAQATEVATLLGTVDERVPEVTEILEGSESLVYNKALIETSTAVYYLLNLHGAQSAFNYEIFSRNGRVNLVRIGDAFSMGSQKAKIILNIVGGASGVMSELCQLMAIRPDTAFILPVGSSATYMKPADYANCDSKNILFVTGLNRHEDDLYEAYDFGKELVRLAAPSQNIQTKVAPGDIQTLSNKILSVAIVTGRVAKYSRQYTGMRGADLIEGFLENETHSLPALNGKVAEGRALLSH